jgi:hypothetical protein
MKPSRFHLAQLNIGRMRGPIDDPAMEGFRSQEVDAEFCRG